MGARVFYGWVVVAAAFAVCFVGFGCAYTFSAFVPALQRDFEASRGSVSLVFSLAGFLYFALGVVSGPLADRWGARRLAMLGMLLVGAGLALAGVAPSLHAVYAAYGLGVGLGIGCAYVPALGAVQRWFVTRRGVASGLAVSGIGVGTLVMPPLATALIDALGWRNAYVALGCGAAIVGIGMAALIANDPADKDMEADARSGMPLRDAVRSRQFALLYAACLVCSFGVFVPFVHLVPYALDHGIGQKNAAYLLGTIGIGSTLGRFFLGGLADKVGRLAFLLAMFAGMAAALAVWAVSTGFLALAGFALLFGLFYGGWVAIMPPVVTDLFGNRQVGSIIGVLYTSVAVGTLLGPTAAGYLFDASGSYTVPILASAAVNVAAAGIAALVGRPA
jgi:MFS transporter, OFA family, oxalate/formate antiporter